MAAMGGNRGSGNFCDSRQALWAVAQYSNVSLRRKYPLLPECIVPDLSD